MKIKDGFIVNKVGSQHVVVPVGETSMERHCMVRLMNCTPNLGRIN